MQILIAAGGTGGHIFPAISLAERLKATQSIKAEILFVCSSKRTDVELLKSKSEACFKTETLPVCSLGRIFSLKLFNFLVRLYLASIKSYMLLRRFKPDIVIGFGGYVSGPVVMLASFMNIPTIIHEQNLIPGKANRLLSRLVDRVAVSFEDTQKFFPQKSVLTGNPIRSDFSRISCAKARRILGLCEDRFTILVMGGSQGAHTINEAILKVISLMDKEEKTNLQLIHLCGEIDKEMVESTYKTLGIVNAAFTFSLDMNTIYSAADVVISRAGATSLAEIAYFGLPSVLIPYPYSKYHQYANAKFFADNGAAVLIEQGNRMSDNLRLYISSLMKDRLKLCTMAEAAKKLAAADSAGCLAGEVLRLAHGR